MDNTPISEEMLNAFVDQQLASEDRLRILQTVSRYQHLGQEICQRQHLKQMLLISYTLPTEYPVSPASADPKAKSGSPGHPTDPCRQQMHPGWPQLWRTWFSWHKTRSNRRETS